MQQPRASRRIQRGRVGSALLAVLTLATGLVVALASTATTAPPAGATGTCTPFAIQGEAPVRYANDVAVDSGGNTFISTDGRVVKIAVDGTPSTFVRSQDATPNLSYVRGIAVDADDNVYVVDQNQRTVYRFDPSGTQTLAIGPTGASPNFDTPVGIDVDASGNIFVADQGRRTVYRFSSAGVQTLAIAATAATPNFSLPTDVAVDGSGNIHVADIGTATIYRFGSSGAQTLAIASSAGSPSFSQINGLAVDGTGQIFVVDRGRLRLYRFSATGTQTLTAFLNSHSPVGVDIDGGGAIRVADNQDSQGVPPVFVLDSSGAQTGTLPGPGPIYTPGDVDANADGTFVATDQSQQFVYRYDAAGAQQSVIAPTAATPTFSNLTAVATDSSGNTYVGDSSRRVIYRFDASGAQTLAIGELDSSPNLRQVAGLAVDGNGNIYAADPQTATIYRFDSTGAQTLAIAAGGATPNLGSPRGVDVDSDGNIYVADASTSTAYRFDSTGTQTLAIPVTAESYGVLDVAATDDGSRVLVLIEGYYGRRIELYGPQGTLQESSYDYSYPDYLSLDDEGFYSASGGQISRGCFDLEDPTVDLVVPADGATVDLDSTVNASYTCADNIGVTSCTGTRQNGQAIPTNVLGPQTFTVTGTDAVGRSTAVTHTYTVVDNTDPSVQVNTPGQNATYARGQTVNANYNCTDGYNGSGIDTCVGDVANGSPIDTATLGPKSFTVTGTDVAGNEKVVTRNYTVTDQTQPAVTLTTPSNYAHYAQGEAVAADFECSDEAAGSGLASCVGSVADGDHTGGRRGDRSGPGRGRGLRLCGRRDGLRGEQLCGHRG